MKEFQTKNQRVSPLKPGTKAPNFTLKTTPDQHVSLRDFLGRPVVLCFYPADWSPVCSDQLGLYAQLMSEFRKFDAELLGVSVDGVWSHLAAASDHGEVELPTAEIDSARRRTGPCGGTVQCSNGARRVRGLPVSLLWGGLPDREEGPEGTRNEAPVRFPKLPYYHLSPAGGMGRGNRRGGRRPGEVLGDA